MLNKLVPDRWRLGAVGAALALVIVAVMGTLALRGGDEAKAQQSPFHGITIQKGCSSPSKAGDAATCEIRVTYADEFGDTVHLHEAFDIQDFLGDQVRVPAVGNLPISAVSGNTTCAVGAFPAGGCEIGPSGSTLGGLPGAAGDGRVTFLSDTYVVQGNDPDPLDDRGTVVWHDHCDAPDTSGCSELENIVQAPASINLVQPAIAVDKTGDAFSKLGDEIDYAVTLSNDSSADTPPLNCTATDSLEGIIFGPAVLPPGDTVIDYTVTAPDGPDPLVNTVDLSCTVQGLGNVLEASDSHTVDLVHPNYTVVKECSPDPVSVGGTISWEVTLTNTGDVALDILVVDSVAGINETVTIAAGAPSTTLTRSRVVVAADAPSISNTVTATATLPADFGLDNVITETATDICQVQVTTTPTPTPTPPATQTPTPTTPPTPTSTLPATPTPGPTIVPTPTPSPTPIPTSTPIALPETLTPAPPPATPIAPPPSGRGGATSASADWQPIVLLAGAIVLMVAGMGSASWALRRRMR